jgi:hypothetical protein
MRFRRGTKAITGSLAVAIATVLGGCVTFAADLVVSESDQVSGSIVVAYAQEIATLVSDDPELSDWQKRYESLPGVSIRGVDRGGQVGNEVLLTNIPIEAFSTAGSGQPPIRIVRDGDNLTISGELDFSGYGDEADSEEQVVQARYSLFASPDLRVSITVPGEIRSTNGTVDDETNTITWRLRLGQENRMEALVYAPPPILAPSMVWAGVAGAVVVGVVAAGVTLLIVRKRRPASAV